MSASSHLILSYLRNMKTAHANGQLEQATSLFEQAMLWLNRSDEEANEEEGVFRFSIGVGLDTGARRRCNEDYCFADQVVRHSSQQERETVGVFVVADGVGGHTSGQEASRLAVHAFVDYVLPHLLTSAGQTEEQVKLLLREGIHHANAQVNERNAAMLLTVPMATTMTVVVSIATTAYVLSVGDSRAYLYRSKLGLHQLTRDHSLVAAKVAEGVITPEEVFSHPQRNVIYRSLGMPHLTLDEPTVLYLQENDILLLCSDGLWEMVRDPHAAAIAAILAHDYPAQDMAEYLTQLALNNGGHDNVGLIVAKIHPPYEISERKTVLLPPCISRR